jgi:Asp-tRNA(Asn)/Glu-tRNA(Gln) amidotransferase B subunit
MPIFASSIRNPNWQDKDDLFDVFAGAMMRAMADRANPKVVKELLKKALA